MITKVTTFNLFLPSRVYFFDSSKMCTKSNYRVFFTQIPEYVSPAPNPSSSRVSPFFTVPFLTPSDHARGTEAAEVFPYLQMLSTHFSIGIPSFSNTDSSIL